MQAKNQNPLITIVTVVLNGEKHLEQAIQSVINQSYTKIEYIIIDGSSTDGTLDIIRHYDNHIAYWVSEPDNGIFDAMNKGIRKSAGEFIGMLNADDWYEPNIISRVVEKIKRFPGPINNRVIYCDYYCYDEDLSLDYKIKQKSELKHWKGMTVSHQAMFVHRFVYGKLRLYSLDYRFASDYEYFLRMLQAGVVFEKLDIYCVNVRKGGVSTQYMNQSISEVSQIIRRYFGVYSKEYPLFMLTNRLPSMLGNLHFLLKRIIGRNATNKLRKLWRYLKETGAEKYEKI